MYASSEKIRGLPIADVKARINVVLMAVRKRVSEKTNCQ